jgi:hypothetical protein
VWNSLSQPKGSDFDYWIRSREMNRPFYVAGHRFDKTPTGAIVIDKGIFELEEAIDVGHMLLSINPVARFSAQIAIWEKNGTLVKLVLIVAVLLLVIVILFLRR